MTCGRVGSGLVLELWGKPLWEKVWPFLDAWDSVRLRTASTQWNIPGKYGPRGELLFFLIQMKPDCWARIFALFREYNLQRLQSMHEESTEGEEMKRQERMKIMKDITKKIGSKGMMDAENRWWVGC